MHLYEGREVVLGPRADKEYVVLSGLQPGERVVTKGNFKIDSALQIQAKPSMMNPADYYSMKDTVISEHVGNGAQNAGILSAAMPLYLAAGKALSEDNPHGAAQTLERFRDKLVQIVDGGQAGENEQGLKGSLTAIISDLQLVPHEIGPLRDVFLRVSLGLKELFETYGYQAEGTLYLTYCPMAFAGKGGFWLQDSDVVANPYYGSRMLRCGAVEKTFGRKAAGEAPEGSVKGSAKGSMGHQH